MYRTIIAAVALAALSGCAAYQEKISTARAEAGAKFTAMDKGLVKCANQAQCDKAFKLARLYVSKTANMRIALNSDNLIQTYPSPRSDSTSLSMSVKMTPTTGDAADIEMSAGCYHLQIPADPAFAVCVDKVVAAFNGFAPFVNSKL